MKSTSITNKAKVLKSTTTYVANRDKEMSKITVDISKKFILQEKKEKG